MFNLLICPAISTPKVPLPTLISISSVLALQGPEYMPPRLAGKKWALKRGLDNEPSGPVMFGED